MDISTLNTLLEKELSASDVLDVAHTFCSDVIDKLNNSDYETFSNKLTVRMPEYNLTVNFEKIKNFGNNIINAQYNDRKRTITINTKDKPINYETAYNLITDINIQGKLEHEFAHNLNILNGIRSNKLLKRLTNAISQVDLKPYVKSKDELTPQTVGFLSTLQGNLYKLPDNIKRYLLSKDNFYKFVDELVNGGLQNSSVYKYFNNPSGMDKLISYLPGIKQLLRTDTYAKEYVQKELEKFRKRELEKLL